MKKWFRLMLPAVKAKYPGIKVVDAVKSTSVEIIETDGERAKTYNMTECAGAYACIRRYGCVEAFIGKRFAVLVFQRNGRFYGTRYTHSGFPDGYDTRGGVLPESRQDRMLRLYKVDPAHRQGQMRYGQKTGKGRHGRLRAPRPKRAPARFRDAIEVEIPK